MFYYKNELKPKLKMRSKTRNTIVIESKLPKIFTYRNQVVSSKTAFERKCDPIIGVFLWISKLLVTLKYSMRERLLVGNECESWESGHEVCDIFIGGKKMNNWWMKQMNDKWVFVWRNNKEVLLAPLPISQITHAICFIGCGK